ncbi:hypothetical protein NMG60_11030360, partial [Bertholletia excelsa]
YLHNLQKINQKNFTVAHNTHPSIIPAVAVNGGDKHQYPAGRNDAVERGDGGEVRDQAVRGAGDGSDQGSKGQGAWYWVHLEPLLVRNSVSGLPETVKLRCLLCDSIFSASNPSRTASEHLKQGTCSKFSSVAKPSNTTSLPSLASPSSSSPNRQSQRKRPSGGGRGGASSSLLYEVPPPVSAATVVGSGVVLSGGKEDLGALKMLEDSVKKLKSPKASSNQTLSKAQIDSALDYLAEWVYESSGSVSFSSLEHPKFRAFLNHVGLPAVSPREFAGSRLDARYEEAKAESEAKIRDAMFFQISSDGWKSRSLVNFSVNLPNGTGVFRRAVFTGGSVPSGYAEEVIWDTIRGICGNLVQNCAGVVADKFKAEALRNLETRHNWMINLSCQCQGFSSLIKVLSKELPLFKNVTENCLKLANFVNDEPQIRNVFRKYQLQEYGQAGLLRVPLNHDDRSNFGPVHTMVEDILSSARALQLVLLDESYKKVSMAEHIAGEIEAMLRDPHFWNELEAVHSLVKLIKGMAQEIETERPLVGQCIPLWDELRAKVRAWCSRFHIAEGPVERLIDIKFQKNYHPAWAAAFILDPLYLIKDTSGKYLPPFKCLTPEQEKDVDKLITRLVSKEEAHIALMELMKWRTEGLDPVYAQAVQLKQRDPVTGKMRIANPQSSRLVWETHLTQFKSLGKVAVRLIFLHATSCGFKCNWSLLRWVSAHGYSRLGIEKIQKLIFISAHSKLEKRDFSTEEEKDAELFSLAREALEKDIIRLERPP